MKLSRLFMLGCALMALVFTSCSGEDGADGNPGNPGTPGTPGTNGEDGEDKPNVDFYFQNGFKGYDGTQDVIIDQINGTSNKDQMEIGFISDGENPPIDSRAIFHFNGISEAISEKMVNSGEDCEDSFYINRATLYIYISAFTNETLQNAVFKIGFYGLADPLFVEDEVTWTMANASEDWGGPGGESNSWVGLSGDDDNYPSILPKGDGIAYGWYPILLPKSVVDKWSCNEDSNKGLRIRIEDTEGNNLGNARVEIVSSDNEIGDLRPLLVIETEKIEPDETAKTFVGDTKEQDWDNMTYEEKMAPLYRFLETKN